MIIAGAKSSGQLLEDKASQCSTSYDTFLAANATSPECPLVLRKVAPGGEILAVSPITKG